MDARLVMSVCLLGLAQSLAGGATVVRQLSGPDACGVNSAQLRHDVEPKRYDVALRLADLRAPDFDGQVEIELNVNGNQQDGEDNLHANQIFLNAHSSMEIEQVWFEKTGRLARLLPMSRGNKVEVVGVCLNTDYQVLVVTLAEDLHPGSGGKLGFRYRAKYGRVGLTRSGVQLQGKQQLHLMFRGDQFARRVFPSFDEPSFKARFALEISCPKQLKPLSNEVSDPDEDGKATSAGNKVNKFAPTGNISTKDLVMSLFSE